MKTLQELYLENETLNYIEPSLYSLYRVKQGLRNENGTGVKVGLTRICDVVGYTMVHNHKKAIDGELIYRGYSVKDLIALNDADEAICGYERAAFLLIFGRLPDAQELKSFQFALQHSFSTDLVFASYRTNSLLNVLQIEVLKLYGQDEDPDTDDLGRRMMKGISIMSSLPLFVFSIYTGRKIPAYPLPGRSFAENILWMARNHLPYTKQEARVLDTLLVLHADHGAATTPPLPMWSSLPRERTSIPASVLPSAPSKGPSMAEQPPRWEHRPKTFSGSLRRTPPRGKWKTCVTKS